MKNKQLKIIKARCLMFDAWKEINKNFRVFPCFPWAKKILFMTFMFFMVNITAYSAEPAKLAIIGDTQNCGIEIDLLTAKLAKDKNIILLERSDIDKILAENEIFLSDISKQSVKIGKIIGADAVIVIEQFKNKKKTYISSRLVRVAEAVIIDNIILPRGKTSETFNWSNAVTHKLKPSIQKVNKKLDDITTVSMLNIRNFDLDIKNQILSTQITKLLSHKLMMSENMSVNERWNMAEVSFEKTLSEKNIDAKYMTGSAIVDGKLKKDGDKLTVSLSLKFANSAETKEIIITGKEDNLPELINKISDSVLQSMNISNKKSNWDIIKEAQTYFEEAKWLYNCGFYKEAQSSADSASALGLKNDELEMLRIKCYGGEPLAFVRSYWIANYNGVNSVSHFDFDIKLIIDNAIYLLEILNNKEKHKYLDKIEMYYIISYASKILEKAYENKLSKNEKYKYKLKRIRFLIRNSYQNAKNGKSLFFYYSQYWNETPMETLNLLKSEYLKALGRKYQPKPFYSRKALIDWENGDNDNLKNIWIDYIRNLWKSKNDKIKIIAVIMFMRTPQKWNKIIIIEPKEIIKYLWSKRESLPLSKYKDGYSHILWCAFREEPKMLSKLLDYFLSHNSKFSLEFGTSLANCIPSPKKDEKYNSKKLEVFKIIYKILEEYKTKKSDLIYYINKRDTVQNYDEFYKNNFLSQFISDKNSLVAKEVFNPKDSFKYNINYQQNNDKIFLFRENKILYFNMNNSAFSDISLPKNENVNFIIDMKDKKYPYAAITYKNELKIYSARLGEWQKKMVLPISNIEFITSKNSKIYIAFGKKYNSGKLEQSGIVSFDFITNKLTTIAHNILKDTKTPLNNIPVYRINDFFLQDNTLAIFCEFENSNSTLIKYNIITKKWTKTEGYRGRRYQKDNYLFNYKWGFVNNIETLDLLVNNKNPNEGKFNIPNIYSSYDYIYDEDNSCLYYFKNTDLVVVYSGTNNIHKIPLELENYNDSVYLYGSSFVSMNSKNIYFKHNSFLYKISKNKIFNYTNNQSKSPSIKYKKFYVNKTWLD